MTKVKFVTSNLNGYTEAAFTAKNTAHRSTAAWLRRVADHLGLARNAYDLRSNKGGMAVPGEVTLHGENLYIQVGSTMEERALVRACRGRRDYTGGPNRYLPLTSDAAEFARQIKTLNLI